MSQSAKWKACPVVSRGESRLRAVAKAKSRRFDSKLTFLSAARSAGCNPASVGIPVPHLLLIDWAKSPFRSSFLDSMLAASSLGRGFLNNTLGRCLFFMKVILYTGVLASLQEECQHIRGW